MLSWLGLGLTLAAKSFGPMGTGCALEMYEVALCTEIVRIRKPSENKHISDILFGRIADVRCVFHPSSQFQL